MVADILPRSVGLSITKDKEKDQMDIVLPKGTPIPISITKKGYTTAKDDQTSVSLVPCAMNRLVSLTT